MVSVTQYSQVGLLENSEESVTFSDLGNVGPEFVVASVDDVMCAEKHNVGDSIPVACQEHGKVSPSGSDEPGLRDLPVPEPDVRVPDCGAVLDGEMTAGGGGLPEGLQIQSGGLQILTEGLQILPEGLRILEVPMTQQLGLSEGLQTLEVLMTQHLGGRWSDGHQRPRHHRRRRGRLPRRCRRLERWKYHRGRRKKAWCRDSTRCRSSQGGYLAGLIKDSHD